MQETTQGLVKEVDDGNLALPEFQRDYRWPDDFIVELLRSVVRGWPIGTFLLLEQSGRGKLLSRKIAGGPPTKSVPKLLILDGQQRATALYQSLTGNGGRESEFFIDMGLLRKENQVTEDCIDVLKDKAFKKRYGKDIGDHASHRVIRIPDLIASSSFNTWLRHVSESEAEQKVYADLKDQHLASLTGYPLRVEKVASDLPIEAIAKIFERTNRSVLQLDAFDLMVAILFPHRKFNLRYQWERAQTRHAILADYRIPGIEVLKVIALREHLRQKSLVDDGKLSKMSVHGVRQSDVLALEPKVAIRDFAKAAKAYAGALEHLQSTCGVIRRALVPNLSMVLPLADAFFERPKPTGPQATRLVRWFWASVFRRDYARGANTRAVTDARLIRAWLVRRGQEPDEVSSFSISKQAFSEVDEGNDILVRGCACLLNTLGAKDWSREAARGKQARRLVDTPKSTELEIHHVFPLEFLDTRIKRAKVAEEVPANQVLIDAGLNSSVRNAAPSSALNNSKVLPSAIASHLADKDAMAKNNYSRFVKNRSEALARAARRAVTP